MSTIAILPVKFDSKRIPMKLMKQFCGRTLWTIVTDQVLKCHMIDRVIISCSDPSFQNVIQNIPKLEFHQRHEDLDGDVELTEVIKECAKAKAKTKDIILQVQLNKPLTKANDIMECLNVFIEGHYDSLATYQEIGTTVIDGSCAFMKSQAICKIWRYRTLMTSQQPYAYSKHNHRYLQIAKHHVEIDDMEDFRIAEALYKAGF